jgi:Domain of unknown function (DUF4279)
MSDPLRLPPKMSAGQPLFTAGGDIDSCSACLRLFGDDLDPDAVTAFLSAKPTTSCKKGDVTRGKVYDRIEKQGKWLLTLNHQRGATLEDLINRLLDQPSGDLDVWRELSSRYRADLFCGLQLELFNRGLEMSPRTLQRIAERGLKFGLDIYYVGESDPPESM